MLPKYKHFITFTLPPESGPNSFVDAIMLDLISHISERKIDVKAFISDSNSTTALHYSSFPNFSERHLMDAESTRNQYGSK